MCCSQGLQFSGCVLSSTERLSGEICPNIIVSGHCLRERPLLLLFHQYLIVSCPEHLEIKDMVASLPCHLSVTINFVGTFESPWCFLYGQRFWYTESKLLSIQYYCLSSTLLTILYFEDFSHGVIFLTSYVEVVHWLLKHKRGPWRGEEAT